MIRSALFEKKLEDYLTIYKIPVGPNQLDPTVFAFSEDGQPPRLLPSIHSQIVRDIEMLVSNQPQRVSHYYLVGPATIPGNKNKTGELKVIIVLNKNLMDVDVDGLVAEELLKLAKHLSGKLAVGTMRSIRYVPTVRNLETNDYEAIYDLFTSQWIKLPNGLTQK